MLYASVGRCTHLSVCLFRGPSVYVCACVQESFAPTKLLSAGFTRGWAELWCPLRSLSAGGLQHQARSSTVCEELCGLWLGCWAGGYAGLKRVMQWNLDFMAKSDEGKAYLDVAKRVDEAIQVRQGH